MALPSLPWRAVLPAILLLPPAAHAAPSTDRVVDFRYGIPSWHQPLGVPDDWHKVQADERGALLYDFGPGPYARPSTRVEASAVGQPFQLDRQEWVDSPRLPVVRSMLNRGADSIEITTLSLPPVAPAASNGLSPYWERLDGITGALGWASPAGTVSPEFRNVAWGINRPLRYRVRVSPGAAKRVMLGFCESYKLVLQQRVAVMQVEGAPVLTIDLALNAPRSAPQVFLFEAADTDRNGWIDVTILAPQGRDPNTTLATIAVYAPDAKLSREELVAGSAAATDHAELRIDCGAEARRQAPRADLIHARYRGAARPQLVIRTGRQLDAGPDGIVTDGGMPFVATAPAATTLARVDGGWTLEFPEGTMEVTAWIFSGQVTAAEVAGARRLTAASALSLAREGWAKLSIPYGRITVADPAIQGIIDASIRTVYQARENINGRSQFNSSFSLYRGLWAGDVIYLVELAAMLGDSAAGRESMEVLLSFQNEQGLVDEMPPQQLFRTTPMFMWAMERDARISGNWDFVRAHWENVRRGAAALRRLREQTLAQPGAPYSGLFPPGFNDGGILDITAEYSSVYWTMIGLGSAERMARALGRDDEATELAELARGFAGSFEKHRQRDQRRDAHGNLYLPVRVGFHGTDPLPQLAQWGVVETHLYGSWLPLDGELLRGSLAMLEAVERQGLPVSTGWMPGGNWAGFGSEYAQLALVLGRTDKTADLLYAVANHASPRGTWVEEQSLVGDPLKLAGDQPHCWASALFVRLAGSMLAYDRDDTLHLLGAVPAEWLRPGAVSRLDGWHTGAGSVTLALTVSADGRTAVLQVEPVTGTGRSTRIVLHTDSLVLAGFTAPASAKDGLIELQGGQRFTLTLLRGNR